MANLIAYIPVPNNSHKIWFMENSPSMLTLIPQSIAGELIPGLNRNPAMFSTSDVRELIFNSRCMFGLESILIFDPENFHPTGYVAMPNEDVSYLFAEKYLYPAGIKCFHFETIWARWDMMMVKREQPVIADCEVSFDHTDIYRMSKAEEWMNRSPDWWRQIGAVAFRDGKFLAAGYNDHYPTAYETGIRGDPRQVFQPGEGKDIYLSLHGEKTLISHCAKDGISLRDASVYVTTFPCGDCARLLAVAGIKEMFFLEGYSVLGGLETLKAAGVRIIQIKKDPVAV